MEPLVVVTLLFGGTWINRNAEYRLASRRRVQRRRSSGCSSPDSSSSFESRRSSSSASASLLADLDAGGADDADDDEPRWRKRQVSLFGFSKEVNSPNTRRFEDYFLSRLLRKFPFLVEAWYWALIYWVYQLGRAFTAVTMVEGTVNVARRHALQVIHAEQRLHLFLELHVQAWLLKHQLLLHWTNRIYSFIHIPGTILFLVWLFYYTTTRNRTSLPLHSNKPMGESDGSPAGPRLYKARRRTMAMCNLIAFVVFTLWPCMPPRLLSDPDVPGEVGEEARRYGFVDTVHGVEGESSVWTQNRFCNQYAAMPSLHFGYALLIGLTILTIPLAPPHRRPRTLPLAMGLRIRVPSARRLLCLFLGTAYPATILFAIVATANHFLLDAVAGAMVCGIAWKGNGLLLNLIPLEDYFLWLVRIHKPEREGGKGDVVHGRRNSPGKGIVVV